MPRAIRVDIKNNYYHVLNRASARLVLFDSNDDYQLFENTLKKAVEKHFVNLISYCCMPNHFHFVVQPNKDGELSKFMYWFTMTLTSRWHALQKTTGSGHIFQGRYKSFIIENDSHLLTVIRYVERNPLRARLVSEICKWKYSSLYRKFYGTPKEKELLSAPNIVLPNDYLDFIQTPLTKSEIDQIRNSIKRNVPYGSSDWRDKMVDKFNLQGTIRKKGRPKKI